MQYSYLNKYFIVLKYILNIFIAIVLYIPKMYINESYWICFGRYAYLCYICLNLKTFFILNFINWFVFLFFEFQNFASLLGFEHFLESYFHDCLHSHFSTTFPFDFSRWLCILFKIILVIYVFLLEKIDRCFFLSLWHHFYWTPLILFGGMSTYYI